jgi:hypothetical protein
MNMLSAALRVVLPVPKLELSRFVSTNDVIEQLMREIWPSVSPRRSKQGHSFASATVSSL